MACDWFPFRPIGRQEGTQFQPMYLSVECFEAGVRDFLSKRSLTQFPSGPMVNFLRDR